MEIRKTIRTKRQGTKEKAMGFIPHYLMQFFSFDHLPPNLREVSEPFCTLAADLDFKLPPNAEKTSALRKLLEAKDCAVRSILFKGESSL